MNTFCGCDPDALDGLAERALDSARRLVELIELLRELAGTVAWIGPDADAHRRRTAVMAEEGLAAAADLRAAHLALRRHAQEQERASQFDPGAAVRAELPGGEEPDEQGRGTPGIFEDPGPWIGGPMAPADPLGPLRDRGLPTAPPLPGGWVPWVGGPMAPADPLDPLPGITVPAVPPPAGGWGPWIGGPFMPSSPLPPPERGPLPEGEEYALAPEILAEAQEDRELALGAVPVVGTIQTAMGVHEELGRLHDRIGDAAEGTRFEPLARVARIPHTASEPLLGEGSTVGQVADALDRGWANVRQTGSEVTAAVGEGDWAGAVRAGERGMYRGAESSADMLSITPIPAHAETGADLIGEGADGLRGISPEAAAGLDRVEGALRGFGEGLAGTRESLTDSETWYDARRRHLPMPWDPRA